MKRLIGRLALLSLIVLLPAAVFAVVAKEAPETATLDDCMNKKSAVEFPHAAHVGRTECKTCHHTQETLTADSCDEVQTCGACHVEPEAAETPKCSEMSSTKNPFHINCVGCHKAEVEKDETSAAPTKCNDCHPKAE